MKAAGNDRLLLSGRHPHAFDPRPPMLEDLHIPIGQVLCCPRAEASIVVVIGSQLADTPKPFWYAVEDLNGTVAVSHIGRMHLAADARPGVSTRR
jgi:hypothetical protein